MSSTQWALPIDPMQSLFIATPKSHRRLHSGDTAQKIDTGGAIQSYRKSDAGDAFAGHSPLARWQERVFALFNTRTDLEYW